MGVPRDTCEGGPNPGAPASPCLTCDSAEVGGGGVLGGRTRGLGLLASSSSEQPRTFRTAGTGAEGAGKVRAKLASGPVCLGPRYPPYTEPKGANPCSLQTRFLCLFQKLTPWRHLGRGLERAARRKLCLALLTGSGIGEWRSSPASLSPGMFTVCVSVCETETETETEHVCVGASRHVLTLHLTVILLSGLPFFFCVKCGWVKKKGFQLSRVDQQV